MQAEVRHLLVKEHVKVIVVIAQLQQMSTVAIYYSNR